MPITIAIDAMGGDKAPREIVRGAIMAAHDSDSIHLCLVGREDVIREELDQQGWEGGNNLEIVPAKEVILMSDSPVEALSKKRGSSIELCTRLIREGKADAMVSAGNTGACVAASSLLLKRLKPVKKPGIAVVFYTARNPVVIIDVGANLHGKPEHLIQHGMMASIYAQHILGVENPRVGLLNVGAEDKKGHGLAKTTNQLFQKTPLNYVGNIEGADIFSGNVEVVVCDGFVGNIVLKVSEGLAEKLLQHAVTSIREGLSALANTASDTDDVRAVLKNAFSDLERRIDYSEWGGAPLLGINGTVIISHGRSDAKAISNAIRYAEKMASKNLNAKFTEALLAV